MIVIGLTGGIASGKSTISDMLKELGAAVIDVDLVGRYVVSQGGNAYNRIIASFGRNILMPDGSINRKKLGNIVFSDREKLRLLNEITHPAIIEKVNEITVELQRQQKKAVVIDAAILIEMGLDKHVDCVWLVSTDRETQLHRVMERDKLSSENAMNRINAQMSNEDRLKYADAVIDTTQPIDDVKNKVKELWFSLQSGEICN
ncbi:MAG: dephospho-CoA kinase [Clostridiales bacterium GWB2_37_7]|nr:MAG: dephospho-CoA kinase [Clostridiales bacterium GWB2_37_7]